EQGPPPSALILVAQGLDRRRKLYTTIRRIGEVQEFPRMSVRQLPSWIAERARQAGRRLDADAVDALVALVGPGLRQLSLEMEKAFAYAGDRDRITRADIEAAVSRVSETTIFMLVDAIGARQAGQAIKGTGHPQLALEMLIADLCVPASEQTGTGERGIAGTR